MGATRLVVKPASISMHGEMRHFAVVTVEVRTDSGAEGLGYSYTVGITGWLKVAHLAEAHNLPVTTHA